MGHCVTTSSCIAATFDSGQNKCEMYEDVLRYDEDNNGTKTAITQMTDCPYFQLNQTVPSK